MNPKYETHKPLLQACCDYYKKGIIVEFGCGDSSTPFLHERYEHMQIITIENRLEWFLRWVHLTSRWHQFVFCQNPLEAIRFAFGARVVFVDCDPGNTRRPIVERLHDMDVGIVVAHDTQPGCAKEYDWGDCFMQYNFCLTDDRHLPHTTSVSGSVDVASFKL
jgi:hypothetical protein